jgi:integrase
MQSGDDWKGHVAMPVYRDKKRWRYRTVVETPSGMKIRISGSTPRNENNRQKTLEMEHAHIERVHTLGRQASTEELANQQSDLFAALPVESDAPAVPTIRGFQSTYLASSRLDNKLSVFESKEHILALHIVPRIGHLRLDEVSFAVVEDFKIALSETRNGRLKRAVQMLNPKTINNVLTTLRHMLQVARKRGLIDQLPEIVRMKAPPSRFDFLTFEESERRIAHAEGEWRTMIIVALRTGLRRGELLGLRWEDVDLVNGRITVRESYVRGKFDTPPPSRASRERSPSATKRGRRSRRIVTRVASACSAMPRVGRSRWGRWRASWSAPAGSPSCARSGGTWHATRSRAIS